MNQNLDAAESVKFKCFLVRNISGYESISGHESLFGREHDTICARIVKRVLRCRFFQDRTLPVFTHLFNNRIGVNAAGIDEFETICCLLGKLLLQSIVHTRVDVLEVCVVDIVDLRRFFGF